MMRIITGTARGVRLDTLEGDATRPTSERAKEAVFSMLQFDLVGKRILDLFSGSGQMALEALSRGSASAVMVDQSKDAIRIITKNAEKTRLSDKCTIVCADFKDYLSRRRGRDKFDYIFLDPPYAMHAIPAAVEGIVRGQLLADTGLLICESGEPDPLGHATGTALSKKFDVVREAKYGVAYVTVYEPARADGQESGEADA
ncbi:MAG: 16S rRNA (guanine(966)-N(2))-methyltransferase RsmD [Clostridia bacterium]|nr:16S rRNA (guanine(966)-N(2))-methyltransferase RsmD [Clostridia bacterium]